MYQSVLISHDILTHDYPEDGVPPGFATVELLNNSSATTEGSSYTSYSMSANDEVFLDQQSSIPLTTSAVIDTDSIDDTYHMHKLAALRKLTKGQTPFVKFPSGNQPVKTSYNPTVWGCLWPTLFPYGVGMFEDSIRLNSGHGF